MPHRPNPFPNFVAMITQLVEVDNVTKYIANAPRINPTTNDIAAIFMLGSVPNFILSTTFLSLAKARNYNNRTIVRKHLFCSQASRIDIVASYDTIAT